ncbi:MAG: tRNA-uridine aminocarboxypropyltransferase [Colwellia sp.]
MHAVHRLHQYRMSLSTTTYKARGQRVIRCPLCRLAQKHCICEMAPKKGDVKTQAAFVLLMYDTEVLKPSNTGKLIADLIPDTYAFLWSRTKLNDELLALLADEQWQPYVVFPQEYGEVGREVINDQVPLVPNKRPLFIMLDGSWREAKKMFRKSPYLDKFPMVCFDPTVFLQQQTAKQSQIVNIETVVGDEEVLMHSPVGDDSRYTVRKTELAHQFSTAEVGARLLDMMSEHQNATLLDLWFDVFNFQYQKSVCQRNKGNENAISNYLQFVENINLAK